MQSVLFNDGAGWGHFQCDTPNSSPFSMNFSYITNVPVDALEAVINAYRNNAPIELYFDAEEHGEWSVVAYDTQAVATLDSNNGRGFVKYQLSLNKNQLAQMLVSDITQNLDSWAGWMMDEDTTPLKLKLEFLLQECQQYVK